MQSSTKQVSGLRVPREGQGQGFGAVINTGRNTSESPLLLSSELVLLVQHSPRF